MMLFHGFKSKKELKETLADAITAGEPLHFSEYIEETSIFGDEYKHGIVKTYCVCMDHPKRTKFANITVSKDGVMTKVA